MHNTGFPPIISGKPLLLILGSMPSEESLRQQQYYAHPRNLFWPIMSELLGIPANTSYQQKTDYLVRNRIALWDVIERCARKGSLDSAIVHESILVNDFATLLSSYTSIEYVFFNGRKAESEFNKRVAPGLAGIKRDIHYELLPSTSPANAGITKSEKFKRWSKIKKIITR